MQSRILRGCLAPGVLGLALLLEAQAGAADQAAMALLGFSKDGRYLAFEQYGVSDASGAPYAEAIIVDVPKNTFAEAPITGGGGAPEPAGAQTASTAEALLRRMRPEIDKRLASRGIVQSDQGDLVEVATTKDASGIKHSSFLIGNEKYELELAAKPVPDKSCSTERAALLELKLKNLKSGRGKTLERDRGALPKRRACAIDYDLYRVYVHGPRLAVFLRVTKQGFEGRDLRYMVITGSR